MAFLLLSVIPSFAASADLCADKGLTIRNYSFKDIWYQRKGGDCTILKRNDLFTIHAGEDVRLYSDLYCETLYCPACTYADYKSFDADGDCRVKILPEHTLSDM